MTLTLLCAAAFSPSLASANIRIEPRLEDPISGVIILIVTNFPIDLFLISAAMYVALFATGRRIGDIEEDSYSFVVSVLVASAVVAVAGGFIDFIFLYERLEDHYALKDLTAWVVLPATLFIFASIAILVYAFVGVRAEVSLATGAAIAPVSTVAWYFNNLALGSPVHQVCGAILIVASGALAFVLLSLLRTRHDRLMAGDLDKTYEGA
ncbi:TPA: hypothetical protein HA259_07455 [Thermoplasmata archaeon]|nr:hypothetical protein [Thermoplasmata archaeon]